MQKRPDAATLQRQCDQFNQAHPIGTPVYYYRVIGETENPEPYRTRTIAQVLSGHTAVVWLEGKADCVRLEAIEVRTEQNDPTPGAESHV